MVAVWKETHAITVIMRKIMSTIAKIVTHPKAAKRMVYGGKKSAALTVVTKQQGDASNPTIVTIASSVATLPEQDVPFATPINARTGNCGFVKLIKWA